MNRIDRALGILLRLRAGRAVSAGELARRFEVSTRTIYRDVDALAGLGVPVYAEMGRTGGFRLLEGYFLPPVTFTEGEAISLLLGLAFLRRLRARPFSGEQDSAGHKLLAAVPDRMRAVLNRAQRFVGFEALPADLFHPEPPEPASPAPTTNALGEAAAIETFMRGLLEGRALALAYRSPYDSEMHEHRLRPLGLIWDRDRWYLVAARTSRGGNDRGGLDGGEQPRMWRADRVLGLRLAEPLPGPSPDFAAAGLLGRRWLAEAMAHWRTEGTVVLRLTPAQAARLRQDWYYGHALFEPEAPGAPGSFRVTFGEDDQAKVFELLRWLGPGAELLQPAAWRPALRAELQAMASAYKENIKKTS